MHTHVGYIKEKIEAQCETIEKLDEKIDKEIEAIDGRVGKLEGWKNKCSGALAIISIIVGAISAKIMKLL